MGVDRVNSGYSDIQCVRMMYVDGGVDRVHTSDKVIVERICIDRICVDYLPNAAYVCVTLISALAGFQKICVLAMQMV